ncbi:NAD-dependent epimerase/dehydratase family protein [bacterium]|nr:NAD-dependent epimerase/dehydratase family protein [bacterium]
MFKLEDHSTVLITGIAGGLAKISAHILKSQYPNIKIVGMDNRECDDDVLRSFTELRKVKYSRNDFEKVFRDYDFDVVLHLGRPSHIARSSGADLAKRLNLNVMGTNKILDLSLQNKVKKVVILSTFHVYGALATNSVFLKESALLQAAIQHPELRDIVEMDQIATNWLWKNSQKIEAVLLRPCNIIGPKINNTMTQFLKSPYAPIPIDFNPMFQFIHEFDMANVLVNSISKVPQGVYNVAGPGCISIKEAKKIIGEKYLPFPIFALERVAKFISSKIWKFPDYLLDYLKYSCIIDTSAIDRYIPQDDYKFDVVNSLELLKVDK